MTPPPFRPVSSRAGLALAAPSRREFLRLLALTSAVPLAATRLLAEIGQTPRPARPLKIIIAGAGLAGLCAAYELEKLGHTCVILEADGGHIGGRARTLRLQDGLYGEAGAMRIPEVHQVTRHYVRELGLTLRPFVSSNDQAYYFLRGQRARIKDVDALKNRYTLTEKERTLSPSDIWNTSVVGRLEKMSAAEKADLLAAAPATPSVKTLDQLSLQQLFEADGFSPEAIELLAVTSGQEAIMGSAATEHLREEMENVWNLSFDEIVGGTDRLPKAFSDRLKSKPRAGCEIIRLEQDANKKRVAAVFRNRSNGGAEEREEGDFLICTLPFPVLSRIETPSFSGRKVRCIRQLTYDSSTKVLAVAKRRFWETDDGIYGGGSFTDLPTATTYYPADNARAKDPAVSAKPAVFLASYSWGQHARRLGILEPAVREQVALEHIRKMHPQLAEKNMVARTVSWSWDRHPWSGGAFAWFNPGQHSALHRHIVEPEGRIHFAGEHTSLTHTWMQGALESALRAVKEVLARAGE
jgi:monoamine oxidase